MTVVFFFEKAASDFTAARENEFCCAYDGSSEEEFSLAGADRGIVVATRAQAVENSVFGFRLDVGRLTSATTVEGCVHVIRRGLHVNSQ